MGDDAAGGRVGDDAAGAGLSVGPGEEALRRRALLARGAWLGAAVSLPTLLAPARALAQDEDGEGGEGGNEQTDALRRLIRAEQAAALAYKEAAGGTVLKGEAQALAEQLANAEDAHATAFTAALEQIGLEAPEAPDSPANVELLEGFEAASNQRRLIDFFVALEQQLLIAYTEAAAALDAADLRRSSAQVSASHGEHLVAWRLLRGDSPADLLDAK